MTHLKLVKTLITSCAMLPAIALSAPPAVTIDYSFEDALTATLEKGQGSATIPDQSFAPSFTDPKMAKTIDVIRLSNLITESLDQYEKARCVAAAPSFCGSVSNDKAVSPRPDEICEGRLNIAQNLSSELVSFTASLTGNTSADKEIDEALDLVSDLAENMRTHAKVEIPYCEINWGPIAADQAAARPSVSGGGSLSVTTGGAQDYDYFKKIVESGEVPTDLVVEGFLSGFNLSLNQESCDKLICVRPEAARFGDKLYVQVGLATGETAENFERKPLNVSIVLDISGSMSATNNTHQNRLEWAKEALVASVNQMNENDLLSIVLFDTESQILLEPTSIKDKAAIFNLISGIQTQGSTNLEAGLRDGYNLVSQNLSASYENRVILISDAGLNTGVTNTSELVRLVSDNAASKIGLTAIGMGDNFNEDFIHAISRSRGGNYLFVQSGAGLSTYFDQFKYLVTPVAYGFKADLDIQGISAKLSKTYGIPQSAKSPVTQIFDIQTLFLTSGGGGAIVLEYDLSRKNLD